MYDVAIIGLGPAGATLARLLDPRLSVVAFDRKTDAGDGFRKPCGGLLAPDAQEALGRLGLALPASVTADPQVSAVRTIDLSARLIRHYPRNYINIDRHKFDRWLMSLIPGNVEVHEGVRVRRIEKEDGGYAVVWQDGEGERRISARHVVGADGAGSAVRRAFFPQVEIRRYLAVQQWFRSREEPPASFCLFDPETTDAYAWGLPKDSGFVFGGAFTPSGAGKKLDRLKEKARPFGLRLERPLKTEACLLLRPTGPHQFCRGRDNVHLVGEAAGLVSPSSFEGISYALHSARLLAAAFNAGTADPGREYGRRLAGLRLKLLLKNLKCPFLYTPLLRRMIMRSGIGSVSAGRPPLP